MNQLFQNDLSPLSQIVGIVEQLSKEQQVVLLNELKKHLILEKTKELDQKGKPVKMSMPEIVRICREVRHTLNKQRHHAS